MLDFGFRVIIAPSFADIFFNNCFKNGILPIIIENKIIDSIGKIPKEEELKEIYFYERDKKTNETILVFDLGGGTFDVSVLVIDNGNFQVKYFSLSQFSRLNAMYTFNVKKFRTVLYLC